MPCDYRAMQLKSAAVTKANTPRRQIDRQIRKLAEKAPQLTDEQLDALAAIIRPRKRGDGE